MTELALWKAAEVAAYVMLVGVGVSGSAFLLQVMDSYDGDYIYLAYIKYLTLMAAMVFVLLFVAFYSAYMLESVRG